MLYDILRWYASSNVQTTLVASGLMIWALVFDADAHGVITTDMSRPPDARMGASPVPGGR